MSLNAKGAHTMNDWTDKIDVENGENIHEMEDNGDTKEAEPSQARHLDVMNVKLTRYLRIINGEVELGHP